MRNRAQITIGLLKAAAAAHPSAVAGEKLYNAVRGALGVGAKAVGHAAEFGGGIAGAAGAHPVVGKVLGGAAAVGGTGLAVHAGGKKVKEKIDEARWRMQYGNQYQ